MSEKLKLVCSNANEILNTFYDRKFKKKNIFENKAGYPPKDPKIRVQLESNIKKLSRF